jgi:hypothetical protein
MTDLGVALIAATALFTVRAVCRDPRWVEYSLINAGLDVIGRIVLCCAVVWALAALAAPVITRSRISGADWALIAVLVLCCGLRMVPGEQWRVLAIQTHLFGHAPKSWIASAAAAGEVRLTMRLLSNGVDVDTRTRDGETALGAAAAAGDIRIARLLMERGANINSRTTISRETPLTMAAQMNRLEMVGLLLDHGADAGARDVTGRTALDWARVNRNPDMTSLLQAPPKK